MSKKIILFSACLSLLIMLLLFGCTQSDKSGSDEPQQLFVGDSNDTNYGAGNDTVLVVNEPIKESNPVPAPVVEAAFKDCGRIDVGKIDSASLYKEKMSCYLDRVKDCKQTKIVVDSESLLGGKETDTFEVLSGTKELCNYKMTVNSGNFLGIDLNNKSITCNIDSGEYLDYFPSHNSILYKCSGNLAEKLKEIWGIEVGNNFQFTKSKRYVYTLQEGMPVLSNEKATSLVVFDLNAPVTDNGNNDPQLSELYTNFYAKTMPGFSCVVQDGSDWLFKGSVIKCNVTSDVGQLVTKYFLHKNGKIFSVLTSYDPKDTENEPITDLEYYVKTQVNFN